MNVYPYLRCRGCGDLVAKDLYDEQANHDMFAVCCESCDGEDFDGAWWLVNADIAPTDITQISTDRVLEEAVKRLLTESMRGTHPFGVPDDFHIGVGPHCESMLLWPQKDRL